MEQKSIMKHGSLVHFNCRLQKSAKIILFWFTRDADMRPEREPIRFDATLIHTGQHINT